MFEYCDESYMLCVCLTLKSHAHELLKKNYKNVRGKVDKKKNFFFNYFTLNTERSSHNKIRNIYIYIILLIKHDRPSQVAAAVLSVKIKENSIFNMQYNFVMKRKISGL